MIGLAWDFKGSEISSYQSPFIQLGGPGLFNWCLRALLNENEEASAQSSVVIKGRGCPGPDSVPGRTLDFLVVAYPARAWIGR